MEHYSTTSYFQCYNTLIRAR